MIGELIFHSRITRQIGAGGMGVVYLARDEQLDRDVAIKVLAPGILPYSVLGWLQLAASFAASWPKPAI